MRQRLRLRRGNGDDSAQGEPAGPAGKTAGSADRAITAGAPERGAADREQAESADDTDRAAHGAASSGSAAGGGADRIWRSPAAGLPTPAGSGDGDRSRQRETPEASKPAASGTYRVLTEEVAGRSRPGTGGTGRAGTEDTAALATQGSGGTGRAGTEDTAALAKPAVTSREPRPAVGDIARLARPAAGAGTTAGDGAGRQRNGAAAGTLRTPPSGSYAPLIGDAAALRANWQRVQGDFVDDPRAAVSDAADLVEHAAQALVGALRQRQQELRGLWDDRLADDAGAARNGGWLGVGRGRGGRARRPARLGAGWLGGGREPDAGPGAERLEDWMTPDVDHHARDGARAPAAERLPDAGVSPQAAAGAPAADTTEHLRLVMQRYRALFNQICRP